MQDLNATKTLNKVQAGAFSIRPSEFSQLNLTLLHKWKYAGGGKCNFCKLMKMRDCGGNATWHKHTLISPTEPSS